MRPKRFILPAILLLALAGTAMAEEIIYFSNGTSMPIRKHEVRGDMIHVDLGSEAFMAFPLKMVEKIEAAGKTVALISSSGGNTIMAARVPTTSGNYPVKGSYSGKALRNRPEVEVLSDDEFAEMQGGSNRRNPQMHYAGAGRGAANKARVGVAAGGANTSTLPNAGIHAPGPETGIRKSGTRSVIGDSRHIKALNGKPGKPVPVSALPLPARGSGSGN